MYICGYFINDGEAQTGIQAGMSAKYRYVTAEEARVVLEGAATRTPARRFTGVVINEETMEIVQWVKYAPKPVLDWQITKL